MGSIGMKMVNFPKFIPTNLTKENPIIQSKPISHRNVINRITIINTMKEEMKFMRNTIQYMG